MGGPEHGRAAQHQEGMGFRAWQEAWFGAGRESVCEISLSRLPLCHFSPLPLSGSVPVLGANNPRLCVEAHTFLAPMLCSGDVPVQCCGEVLEVQQVFMIPGCMLCLP